MSGTHMMRPQLRRRQLPKTLLTLFSLLTAANAISLSARRVQTSFSLLTNSTKCASSITHARIRTFRQINPSEPDNAFDGILWDALVIDGARCVATLENRARQSTYFRPRETSPPGVPADAAQPFFLDGRDNSPRKCDAYNTTFPATYLFTDDLPTFRERFVRQGLLDPGVEEGAVRGVVYMFAIPATAGADIVGRACAYVQLEDVVVASPAPAPADMPACFPGDAVADTPSGGARMRELAVGDVVSTPSGREAVISFTHRSAAVRAWFARLRVGNVTVELSEDHLISVRGRMVRAGSVAAGDVVDGPRGGVVHRVSSVRKSGLYAPVTESGVMLVNGVVVSCYTSAFGEVVAHALLGPVRAANHVVWWDVCALVDGLRSLLWG